MLRSSKTALDTETIRLAKISTTNLGMMIDDVGVPFRTPLPRSSHLPTLLRLLELCQRMLRKGSQLLALQGVPNVPDKTTIQ
jgi:hypothetical protein